MEGIIKELIRENMKNYDCVEDMLWGLFVSRIDEESICDLLQVISFDAIMDFLKERNEHYTGYPIIEVANLYILVLAKEILKSEFPKLYLTP